MLDLRDSEYPVDEKLPSLSEHNYKVQAEANKPASKYYGWIDSGVACNDCYSELKACLFAFRKVGSLVSETDVWCPVCDKKSVKLGIPTWP